MTDEPKLTVPAKRHHRKGGRPTKFTPATVQRILDCVERGVPLTLAASAAGIAYQSLVTYRNAHKDFAAALELAIARGVEKRLAIIVKAADAGDVSSARWWLEHVLPQYFSRTRVELEAIGTLEHSFAVPPQVLSEIADARVRLEKKQNEPKQLETVTT
jgi:hypothetical protein